MKALLIGYGSIGQRRARHLDRLFNCDLVIVEPNSEKIDLAKKNHPNAKLALNIEQSLSINSFYDLAIISVSNDQHITCAQKILDHAKGIFIEKPLSDTMEKTEKLLNLVRKKQVITMVGCNMRFYPTLRKMSELINHNTLGRLLYGRLRFGQYLPDWRPSKDYRNFYSAKRKKGGGIILDDIHELDLACHLFGEIKDFSMVAQRLGNLKIDVEDFASINLKMESRAIVQITMDYLHPVYQRQIEVIGEKGALRWDEDDNTLWLAKMHEKKFKPVMKLPNYDYDNIYQEELKYFVDCVKKNRETENSFFKAAKLLKWVLAMRKMAHKEMDNA